MFGGDFRSDPVTFSSFTDDVEDNVMMVNIGFDWILYTQSIDYFRRDVYFLENKKHNRYLILKLLSFSVTSIFHAIIVEKQIAISRASVLFQNRFIEAITT